MEMPNILGVVKHLGVSVGTICRMPLTGKTNISHNLRIIRNRSGLLDAPDRTQWAICDATSSLFGIPQTDVPPGFGIPLFELGPKRPWG